MNATPQRVARRNLVVGTWDLVAIFLLFDLDRWSRLAGRVAGRDPLDLSPLLVVAVAFVAVVLAMLAGRGVLFLLERIPRTGRWLATPLGEPWSRLAGRPGPWASFRLNVTFIGAFLLLAGLAGTALGALGLLPGPGNRGANAAWIALVLIALVAALFLGRRASTRQSAPGPGGAAGNPERG